MTEAAEIPAEVRQVMTRIPLFVGRSAGGIAVERLGGLTNRVYRVAVPDGRFVLRVPGEGTEAYIDRQVELHNARVAADADVSAEVLWADAKSGLMVTRFIDQAATMDAARFRDLGAVARAARAFRRLHDCGVPFAGRFELFAKMDEYQALLARLNAPAPAGYEGVKAEAAVVRAALGAHPAPLAPCHCDPVAENFLDTGERMVIVDWEYSGMNDPMWDLGDLSVEAGFGPEQEEALLAAYFEGPVPAAARGRIVLYKAMCDLLWTLWGVVQHASGNPAEDFQTYAAARLARCRALLATPDFARHLEAVAGG
jgi:thiamine kinase-like enzyme